MAYGPKDLSQLSFEQAKISAGIKAVEELEAKIDKELLKLADMSEAEIEKECPVTIAIFEWPNQATQNEVSERFKKAGWRNIEFYSGDFEGGYWVKLEK